MLKEFSVIGFKNFRDRITFSLGKPKNYDFNTDQISIKASFMEKMALESRI